MGVQSNTVTSLISSIPEYPDFRPIDLNDRDAIEELLYRMQPTVSELTFANMYVWRRTYNFELSRIDEVVVVRATDRSGQTFFLPPISAQDSVETAVRLLSDHQSPICRVPEIAARQLESRGFSIELDRDNSDYVYLTSNLVDLPGRKFHRKRNHIAQFNSKHNYEYRRVTPELAPKCADLQQMWCDIRDCFTPENFALAEEHAAVMDALSLLETLHLAAGAIIIDDNVEAFGIGGKLNDETFVVHFEKASPAYPGLYQIINRDLCADAAAGFKYVNREQDLGEEGLRKAKESYYPHRMVHKYIVRP